MSRIQKQGTKRLGLWLWFLLLIFCMRVFGQLAVAAWNVSFLPPMEEWFSGLIPYPALLFVQFVILGVLAIVCLQFYRNEGWFVRPHRGFGSALVWFGSVSLILMVIRYFVRM